MYIYDENDDVISVKSNNRLVKPLKGGFLIRWYNCYYLFLICDYFQLSPKSRLECLYKYTEISIIDYETSQTP